MKKIFFVLFGFALMVEPAVAQGFGTVDLRNRNENTEHIVSFCARNSPNLVNFPTHMFVTFAKFSSDGSMEFIEAMGWMPHGDSKMSVSAVPGYFKPELITHASQQCFNVKVNGDSWQNAYALVSKTIANFDIARLAEGQKYYLSYFLLEDDCITFAQDVARTIGLSVPQRGSQIPIDYIKALYQGNAG